MAESDYKIVPFKDLTAFERWLEKSFETCPGIWMQLYKKDSGVASIRYDEAVEVALCFGWIDGQKRSHDAQSWLQKFTPRRSRSIWSKRNIELVERLTSEKRMRPSGLEVIEAAKADGRWDRAYDSPKNMQIPADFLAEVKKHKAAYAFFQTLSKTNLYTIGFRLQAAKNTETRTRRIAAILDKLKKKETP